MAIKRASSVARHLGRQPERSVEKDTLEHFERFCYSLRLPDDGGRFRLEDWQLCILADYFDGIFENLWLLPTGQGKSTLLGALALHHGTYVRVNPRVYILGGLGRHGRNTLDAAAAFIGGSTDLQRWWVAQEYDMGRIKSLIAEDTKGSGVDVVSAGRRVGERGGSTVEGSGPTLILVEETHRHEDNGAAVRTITSKAQKRSQGRHVVRAVHATTAGDSLESPLGRMVARATDTEAGATIETDLRPGEHYRRAVDADGDLVMHEWAVPDTVQPPAKGAPRAAVDRYLREVKKANPASFVTIRGLRLGLKAASSEIWVFLRQHANQWVTQDFAAIDKSAWQACARDKAWAAAMRERAARGAKGGDPDATPAVIPKGAQGVYVGLDMAEKWDTTSMVPVWVNPATGRPVTAGAVVLKSKHPGKRRRQRDAIDVLEAMRERWPTMRVVFDNAKGGGLIAEQFEEDHGLLVVDHSQGVPMELASMLLGEYVDQHGMDHDGNPELTKHVTAAIAKRTGQGRRWRLEKPRDGRPVDGAVALAMGLHIAVDPPDADKPPPNLKDYRIERL